MTNPESSADSSTPQVGANGESAHSARGVTVPQGFRAASVKAGIKPSGKTDLALVVNDGPEFSAAGVFTRNRVVAAPVQVSRQALADGQLRAVLYNAGNANACNGALGLRDAQQMQTELAELLNFDSNHVAVCSTGLIGEPMPMDAVSAGIEKLPGVLGNSPDHGEGAARAIMTTDTTVKQTLVNGDGWSLGGMGKGVGMMAPSLATMLVCLTTDLSATPEQLAIALQKATALTFDTLDVDGSTSTNDTVVLMASGASGETTTQEVLNEAVLAACADLADQLQADAEGVTKRVKITVEGTRMTYRHLTPLARWAATTFSNVPCSVQIPTGGAFWPPSVWLMRTWIRITSASISIIMRSAKPPLVPRLHARSTCPGLISTSE